MQLAYAEFMENSEAFSSLSQFYQKRRDLFLSLIRASRFEPLPCRGTYFQMVSYRNITDVPDVEFARQLTTEHKVAAIPPSVFYANGDDHKVLRFCFAKKDETLEEAAEILCGI